MIEQIPFGATGHVSSRAIFGAAALGAMRQEKADATIEMVRSAGINHFDTAASSGDSELRLADFLQDHRDDVFLATKTGDRDGDGARASIERSLTRMQIDQVDLIQFHNLAQDGDWDQVMGPGGALAAAIQAREEGLVRFIGVTGHGTRIAEMHLRSLERFDFASVLLPYNYLQLQEDRYRSEFEALYALCTEKGVAMQTIKSIALRRWRADDPEKRFSWYRPINEAEPMKRAIDYVLSRPDLFLNTSSDASLLEMLLSLSAEPVAAPDDVAMAADAQSMGVEPLFVRDVSDDVMVKEN